MKNKNYLLFAFILQFIVGSMFLFASGDGERYTTDVNTKYVKDYLNSGNIDDEREGIYIQSNGGNNPYLLAIAKNTENDMFYGIYLSGPGGSDWQEGNIKAIFSQAGSEFRGTWYSRSGIYGDNARFVFGDSTLWIKCGTYLITDYYFAKIYPYARGFARERGVTGTGFLINREGYVVTNFHVIKDTNYILIRGINGDFSKAYPYIALLIDQENDIAILKPEVNFIKFSDPPYRFRTAERQQGSKVFALGYPMRAIMGDEIKLTDGIIAALTGFQGNPNAYQTTATISPGNSGGPLFDEEGNVIGINSSILTDNLTRNVNYSIKIKYMVDLINKSSLQIYIPLVSNHISNSLGTTSNLVERTSQEKNFVFMIEAF